jgi:hypothetical protein
MKGQRFAGIEILRDRDLVNSPVILEMLRNSYQSVLYVIQRTLYACS